MENNGNKINIDIILRLFDQVKESSSDNTNVTRELKEAIKELMIYFDNQPDNSKICSLVKDLSSKINRMILVVIVAMSILTASYLFVRSTVDSHIDKKIEIIMEELKDGS
jgi:hypothetical protein